MKLHAGLTINNRYYPAGSEVSAWKIYPFFLIHMGMFGLSGFFLAYFSDAPMMFIWMHGGIAVSVYLIFYWAIFGTETVKWLLINSLLGVFGIYAEMNMLMANLGKHLSDYPLERHIIPFAYYVLYTFLLRQLLLDATGARENPIREKQLNTLYIGASSTLYLLLYWLG